MHAALYLGLLLKEKKITIDSNIVAKWKKFPSIKELFQIIFTFFSVTLSWAFFRSETIVNSFGYLNQMASNFSFPNDNRGGLFYVITMLILDWISRKNERSVLVTKSSVQNWTIILVFSLTIIFFSFYNTSSEFIYYQF
tara:strand:- start:70 stop:486 length:417 start_codon:yes stop_codon:yes gene_type:complete